MQQPLQPDDDPVNAFEGPGRKLPYVILLMDDEESILGSFGKLLEIEGFVVYRACSGEQAILLYQQALSSKYRVDVAVLDLTIYEGMGGLETVARLKEIHPGVRAIATTGHFRNDLVFDYKKYGFVGFLRKPFILKELLEAIDKGYQDGAK